MDFYSAVLPVPTCLNRATTFVLQPVHYLYGKRVYTVIKGTVHKGNLEFGPETWVKVAMVGLLIPSVVVGTVFRILSLTSPVVRTYLSAPPVPPVVTHRTGLRPVALNFDNSAIENYSSDSEKND
jgi:hypothetical protein